MSEGQHFEPIVLDYARREAGRFESLREGEPDLGARKTGLKLWAFVTLLTYFAALLVIYAPIAVFCFWAPGKNGDLRGVLSAIAEWWFWLIVAGLLLTQILLLVVPVQAAWDYQIKPRRLIVPVATACTLLALLLAGAIASILALVFGDDQLPVAFIAGGFVVAASWFVWWWIFRRNSRASPDHAISGTQRALIRGSITELIVAISCHIWVRGRGDCSAPAITFIAICAGVAILLCAYGPGVFFLFVSRSRQMRSKRKRTAGCS